MVTVGINVDPRNASARPGPAYVRQLGFGGIRLSSTVASNRYAHDFATSGLVVLGIVTSESEGYLMAAVTLPQFAASAWLDSTRLTRTIVCLTLFPAGMAAVGALLGLYEGYWN